MPPADAPVLDPAWSAVVPVKQLAIAKSRLQAYGDEVRRALALSFALDVVDAARTCAALARVLVVTDDADVADAVLALGANVTPEPAARGLNEALRHGADLLRAAHPGTGVVTISADLPCLCAADLAGALSDVPVGRRGLVADAEGRGTTLLAAAPGVELDPRFGSGSRALHLQHGAVELHSTPSLRQDVDTPADLLAALRLGVGPRTLQVVAARGL